MRVVLIVALASLADSSLRAAPEPLPRLHAHNDYLHPRPLLDALDRGFCSVEADIYLVDGELLVAHDRPKARPDRTLKALYLDPLRERAARNQGRVYPNGPEFDLLIDLKDDWRTIYPVLRDVLKTYSPMLTTFAGTNRETRAVLVVLSGSRSPEMFGAERVRYAALDGELKDLDSDLPADLVPWISGSWSASFKWRGANEIPEPEQRRLNQIVERAHRQGRRVRFWGAPDQPVFWREMLAAGVDLINTDRLDAARDFLLSFESSHPPLKSGGELKTP